MKDDSIDLVGDGWARRLAQDAKVTCRTRSTKGRLPHRLAAKHPLVTTTALHVLEIDAEPRVRDAARARLASM